MLCFSNVLTALADKISVIALRSIPAIVDNNKSRNGAQRNDGGDELLFVIPLRFIPAFVSNAERIAVQGVCLMNLVAVKRIPKIDGAAENIQLIVVAGTLY